MPTFSQLPSGKWRVQVRRRGIYKAQTFTLKRDAEAWAREAERQADSVSINGFAPVPRGITVADLIDEYTRRFGNHSGKTKTASLAMLRRMLGQIHLAKLSPIILRDFIDRREEQGAGGVTIAADLSFLSAVLKWARHDRKIDVPERLALEARASLKYRTNLRTRSVEREREPTDDELQRLFAHWEDNPRQRIDMVMLCRFALATGMRLGEICRIEFEDIDRKARTVVIRDRKDPRNKAGNHQVVPLLPDAWKIIEPWLTDDASGFVFPVKADSVSTAFTRACQNVTPPIVDLHFHDLRHRATAQFFSMGLDIPRVALLTGHKTWAMLRRYTRIKPADVHAVVSRTTT